jgi:ribosomal-protein-serine acetyltransferase
MDPVLIDVPERVLTERFIVRCPQPGDGAAVNAAVCETLAELRPWMPW